ncbi:MAG: RdgB/HAM1 family non-canonical purine NTP pyrophosphatase [Ancalomicrobiaceae bacterium]|nr:RdgB/HAM1 family non-canonical purine NTP pyrophosphatase [Ancalomicrobiaceae bacterium]
MTDRLTGRLVIATHNAGKLAEFRDLTAPYQLDLVSAGELELPEPEETGMSFEENAALKALAAARASGHNALADDSGLCVEALGGEPGIYSARWAGSDRNFARAMRNVDELLSTKGVTGEAGRRAYFVAVLCLAHPDGSTELFRGEVHGTLVWPPRGNKGFGYDPMFRPDGYHETFGEMPAEAKHGWTSGSEALSHRARAFKLFAERKLGLPG